MAVATAAILRHGSVRKSIANSSDESSEKGNRNAFLGAIGSDDRYIIIKLR